MQYWDVTQLLAFLSSLYEVWGLLPDTVNTSSHAYNPKTWDIRQKEQTLEVILELKEGLLCSEGVTLSAHPPHWPGLLEGINTALLSQL